jgi:hypothetical protein
MNGKAMIENEPGGESARYEHWNPRNTQTKPLSAKGTTEELDQQGNYIVKKTFKIKSGKK